MSVPVPCDDCGQPEPHRIHRDVVLKHFHLFSTPVMDRPASDFPEGWPAGMAGMLCGGSRKVTAEQRAHDLELIRRQAWKWWQQEEDQRCIVGDAPLGD